MGDVTLEALLPCPFCGGAARLWHDDSSDYERHWTYQVECVKCEASTQSSKARGYAIEFWNARLRGTR